MNRQWIRDDEGKRQLNRGPVDTDEINRRLTWLDRDIDECLTTIEEQSCHLRTVI
jgi:hypothetical protein